MVLRQMRMRMRKAESLRCLSEFADVPAKELVALSKYFDEMDYAKGSVLMREGDIGRQAFVIVDGSVAVTLRGKQLAVLGRGEVVGEMALMDGEPRSATVTALEDVRTLVASRLDFGEFTERPEGWRALARALSRRIRTVQPTG
jgi:CRP/FNR family transcriptional regulator, cyclic AMP receptor protein